MSSSRRFGLASCYLRANSNTQHVQQDNGATEEIYSGVFHGDITIRGAFHLQNIEGINGSPLISIVGHGEVIHLTNDETQTTRSGTPVTANAIESDHEEMETAESLSTESQESLEYDFFPKYFIVAAVNTRTAKNVTIAANMQLMYKIVGAYGKRQALTDAGIDFTRTTIEKAIKEDKDVSVDLYDMSGIYMATIGIPMYECKNFFDMSCSGVRNGWCKFAVKNLCGINTTVRLLTGVQMSDSAEREVAVDDILELQLYTTGRTTNLVEVVYPTGTILFGSDTRLEYVENARVTEAFGTPNVQLLQSEDTKNETRPITTGQKKATAPTTDYRIAGVRLNKTQILRLQKLQEKKK